MSDNGRGRFARGDEPFAQPEGDEERQRLVRWRRRKRRAKAAVAVGLALAAGAFLSCQRMIGKQEAPDPQPVAPPAPAEPPPANNFPIDAGNDEAPTPGLDASTDPVDDAADADADATALVPAKKDAGKKKKDVDIRQHRKGMPVPDNLLE